MSRPRGQLHDPHDLRVAIVEPFDRRYGIVRSIHASPHAAFLAWRRRAGDDFEALFVPIGCHVLANQTVSLCRAQPVTELAARLGL